jgi:hypothetical protein
MTNRSLVFCLALLSVLFLFPNVSAAQTHEAHEHGVAHMDVTVEDAGFEVELDSPLASFISFEHSPSTPEQTAEAGDMVAKLALADELFRTPAAAGCQVASISLRSANLPDDILGQYAAKGEIGRAHV